MRIFLNVLGILPVVTMLGFMTVTCAKANPAEYAANPCAVDINRDGRVTLDDAVLFFEVIDAGARPLSYDFNNDGHTDDNDGLTIFENVDGYCM